jgi:uncharacterized protein YydD (DUF2326 family)
MLLALMVSALFRPQQQYGFIRALFMLRTTLRHYEESLASEVAPAEGSVVGLFEAAQAELPNEIRQTIEQVEAFHQHVIHNRAEFLREERENLQAQISGNEAEEARIAEERSKALSIIDSYRALDEYNQLHDRLADLPPCVRIVVASFHP